MRIMINGKTEESSVSTVLELLQSKEIEPQMVSVELNSKILDREAYSTTQIQDNDVIEFLFFMGGGMREWGVESGKWKNVSRNSLVVSRLNRCLHYLRLTTYKLRSS